MQNVYVQVQNRHWRYDPTGWHSDGLGDIARAPRELKTTLCQGHFFVFGGRTLLNIDPGRGHVTGLVQFIVSWRPAAVDKGVLRMGPGQVGGRYSRATVALYLRARFRLLLPGGKAAKFTPSLGTFRLLRRSNAGS